MTNPKDIGHRIEQRRKELDLTLKEVADRACVSLSTISRYERGEFDRIKLPVVMAIANALQVSHDYIVCKTDDPFFEINAPLSDTLGDLFTTSERELIAAYNAASVDDRAVIDLILSKYKEKTGEALT